MHGSKFETLVGTIVLILAIALMSYSYTRTTKGNVKGYDLVARFDRVDGLSVGSDVRIAGVKIGSVSEMKLDKNTYLADVRFKINQDIQVPEDTVAEVMTDGLLGNKFLSLLPGASETNLKANEYIRSTQGTVSIESLISKYLFGGNSQGSPNKNTPAAPESAPTGSPIPQPKP